MQSDPRTVFEDAVDIPLWLEADRDTPLAARIDRDRDIGLSGPTRDDLARVRHWWSRLRPGPAAGTRLAHGRRLVSLLLVALGATTGAGFAAAALHYDGSTPVNVVAAFAILVGVQTVFLVLTLVMLLPGRFGVGGLQRSLAAIDPAAIAAGVYRRLARTPPGLDRLFAWHAGRSAANRFAKWQLLAWSQTAAVAFNVGLLATSLALVTFTDLAFGWSTTLAATPEVALSLVHAVSVPWAALAPQAVPTLELVEASRVFRLEQAAVPARAAEAFTGWWPFLLAGIVTYGLVPRLALAALAAWRLAAATRHLLLDDARVTALLDRLASPALHLAADVAEIGREAPTENVARPGRDGGGAAAVAWAEAVDADIAARTLRTRLAAELLPPLFSAGGGASLDEDGRTIERLAALDAKRVVVFTRAYEPPLLEFVDFLRALRVRLGASPSIVVCPMPEPGREVTPDQIDTWRRTLGRAHDARLYVEAGA